MRACVGGQAVEHAVLCDLAENVGALVRALAADAVGGTGGRMGERGATRRAAAQAIREDGAREGLPVAAEPDMIAAILRSGVGSACP